MVSNNAAFERYYNPQTLECKAKSRKYRPIGKEKKNHVVTANTTNEVKPKVYPDVATAGRQESATGCKKPRDYSQAHRI